LQNERERIMIGDKMTPLFEQNANGNFVWIVLYNIYQVYVPKVHTWTKTVVGSTRFRSRFHLDCFPSTLNSIPIARFIRGGFIDDQLYHQLRKVHMQPRRTVVETIQKLKKTGFLDIQGVSRQLTNVNTVIRVDLCEISCSENKIIWDKHW